MPYEIGWYIPQRVIYERVWGKQTLAEIREVGVHLEMMLSSGKPPMHFIIDGRDIKTIPLNMAALRENLTLFLHPSLGYVVEVESRHSTVKFLVRMIANFFKVKAHSTPSLEDALAFLSEQDPSINFDSPNPSFTSRT